MPEHRIEWFGQCVGSFEKQVIGEFAPGKLAQIRFGTGAADQRVPDFCGAGLAEVQMRRQAGGAVVIGAVALVFVRLHARMSEALQPLAGSVLARSPWRAQAGGPVDFRFQVEFAEVQRVRPRGGRGNCVWCRQRPAYFAAAVPDRAPEWGEDPKGAAAGIADRSGIEEQAAVEVLNGDAVLAQSGLEVRFAGQRCRFVDAIAKNAARAAALGDVEERLCGGAATDDQPRTEDTE